MRILILIALSFFGTFVYASNDSLESRFEKWDEIFHQNGYHWFNQFPTEILRGFGAHQIYYSLERKQMVAVRFFKQDSKSVAVNRNTRFIKTETGTYYFHFSGFSETQQKKIMNTLVATKTAAFSKSLMFINMFLPRAYAANSGCWQKTSNWSQYQGMFGSVLGQSLMNCLSQAFSSAKTALDGKIESVTDYGLSFSFSFVTKAFSGLMDLATNFPTHLKKTIEGAGAALDWLKNSSFEDKMTIICNLLGNLGADALTKMLTLGAAGVAALLLKVSEILSKFSFLKKLMDLKQALMEKGKELYDSMKESVDNLIKGVLSGKISKEDVLKFEKQTRASCALAA